MGSFLRHVTACNAHDLSGYRRFLVAGHVVGWLRPEFADELAKFGDPFERRGDAIAIPDRFDSPEPRTRFVNLALGRLVERGTLHRLRGEVYPVVTAWGATPLMGIDRAAVPYFGLKSFGLHVNGFVRKPDGLHLWVGHRSTDRGVAPGKLDNLVAGGQPLGLSLTQNLIKEAEEEAGLAPELASRAVPVGAITYLMGHERGVRDDTLFCFDLELDPSVVPVNRDGEVERFELWPIERVAASVSDGDDWKFNVNLVVIDFLIRHGVLTPDHPEYLDLCVGLRRRPLDWAESPAAR